MKNNTHKYRLTAAVTAAVLLLTAAGCGGKNNTVLTETRESLTETQLCTTEPETECAKTTETESAPVSETVTEKKTVRIPERQTEPVRETEPERTTESAAEFPGAVYPLSYNEYTLLCSVVIPTSSSQAPYRSFPPCGEKLANSAVPPFPKKSFDFSGTPKTP